MRPMSVAAPVRVRCCSMGSKQTTIVFATLVLAAWGAFAGVAGADPPATPTPPTPSTPPPQPQAVMDHDGTYMVGTDIVPGTYSSAGPVEDGTCYWKRMSDVEHNQIIDNAMSKKPQQVQIEPSDQGFKTDGCQPWQMTDGANAPPAPAGPQAQNQLHNLLGGLNAIAGQAGGGQVPGP